MNHVRRRTAMPTVGIALTTIMLAGCSPAADSPETPADDVIEQVAEEDVNHAAEEDVDLSIDDDTITATTEDGELAITPGRLPDQWPDTVPVPTGHEVEGATAVEEGETLVIIAALHVEGSFDDVHAELESAFAASPWEAEGDPVRTNVGEANTWHAAYVDGNATVTVQLHGSEGSVAATYSIHWDE